MKAPNRIVIAESSNLLLAILLFALVFVPAARAAGTWTPLAHPPPGAAGHFLLLSDGTVMAENLSGGGTNYGPGWFRLTPDIHGSYVNGTWSTLAPMHYTRLDFSSIVMGDGRVFVAGGEYGSGTNNAEVYDPVANTWTMTGAPPAGQGAFLDSGAMLIADGNVLVAPVNPATNGSTVIFEPGVNLLTNGPTLYRGKNQDEATWVKLPDASILTVDPFGTNSERYIPYLNKWVNDANVPVSLYDPYGGELGPAMLLPNGKAIFFGATGHTAIYTPSGNTSPGTWVAGPDFPNGQGQPDAPAAMLSNGKILCVTCPTPTSNNHFPTNDSFYEYDYVSNTFTRVSAPGGGLTFNSASWPTLLLDLPDGSVLFGHRSTDFYVYKPDGSPIAAGKPYLSTVTTNYDGSLHLTGHLFNGICQGASYGDDEQMDTDFPIVRFTDAGGNVRYGRTFNWGSTGVMTGNEWLTTDCTLPPGASSHDLIQVIANGIASDGFGNIVTTTNDNGPGSLRQIVGSVPAGSTVIFATNLSGQTITLTTGEIALTNNVTIDGSALASPIRLNGNHQSRIFNVANGATVTLNSLVITNGFAGAGNWGGAIQNSGTLAINHCTLSGNSVDSASDGGAIINNGPLTLTGCTFWGNTAGYAGAVDNHATCVARDCTFYGNSAIAGNGGAFDNASGASLSILQCTLYHNSASVAGGGIDNFLGRVNLTNSIVAGNSAVNSGDDIYNYAGSTNTAGGSNIVQALDNQGVLNGANTIVSVNPLLGPLADNGGPTLTMLPQIGSPAIDAGVTAADGGLTYDQRGAGFPRVVGDAVDIGAVEASIVPYVFNNGDSGYGSLRYAVHYATNNSTITFSSALSGQTILLTNEVIALNQNVTLDASALANRVLINGNHTSQAFSVGSGVNAVLDDVTITNCFTTSFGGGIVSYGNLTLNNCRLVNNQSTGTAGALASVSGRLVLNQTTVSGNQCGNCSAIYLQTGTATFDGCTISGNNGANGDAVRINPSSSEASLTAINSTFASNSVSGTWASAISLQRHAGSLAALMLTNCTIAGNLNASAGQPGAIYLQSGSGTIYVMLDNTIISGNTAGGAEADITGQADGIIAYNNLIGAGGGLVNGVNGNQVGVNHPLLAALGNYGGPTLTMPPLLGSPALNAGLNSLAAGLAYDQRGAGYPRIVGTAVDIGAVESQLFTSPIPSMITGVSRLGSGAVSFSFTNLTGASFSVWASTNLALPFSDWSDLGAPLESPAGTFQFTDPQATNYPYRFYRVTSP